MENGIVKVEDIAAPFLSSGIYSHYHTILTGDGQTVQFVPNFLFGIPQSVLEKFYKGAEGRSCSSVWAIQIISSLLSQIYLSGAYSSSQ